MATPMKRSFEEITAVGLEGENVEGALNQIEDKGNEGTLNQSEDEESDEGSLDKSEDEEGSDEGNVDESEGGPAEGTFQESEDEESKSSFRAAWDYNLVFDEKSSRKYTDDQKKIIQYYREMRETEGFGVTCDPDIYMMCPVSPVCLENSETESYKKVERCGRCAIDLYNQKKNETLDLLRLEKATVRLCGAFLFCITFTAINSKTYETKVFYHKSKPHSVALFREKKSPQV